MKSAHRRSLPMALLLVLALAVPCRAADGDGDPAGDDYVLETVKVTAQKREENVQEVPGAVSVLSDVALEEARVTDVGDLYTLSPNLYYSSAGQGSYSYLGIRGRTGSGVDLDPTVTVFVDGVPYDDFFTLDTAALFDVERVEVLRGPQSTLYGLNSVAGVINIVTRQPGDEPHASVGAEISDGPDRDMSTMVKASVSGPVVRDVLSLGVAAIREDQGGWVWNEYTDDYANDSGKTSGRFSAVWTPVDKLTARGGVNLTEMDVNAGYVYLPLDDDAARRVGRPDKEEWTMDNDYSGFVEGRSVAPNLNLQYEAPWFDAVSVTTYRDNDQKYGTDFDLTCNAWSTGVMESEIKTFTQELRLQSPDHGDQDSSWDWTVGYFRYDMERDQVISIGGAPMIGGVLSGVNDAVFGQTTYRVFGNALGLTVGGRYEATERELTESVVGYDDTEVDDSQFLPKFALDYRFTPEVMAYASATMGWRTGGVNNNMAAGKEHLTYDKETSWTYELGAKTQFLDNTLLLNAAVFHSIYKDYQDLTHTAALQSYLDNADEVTMTGFEVEAAWRPVRSLELTGSLGYVKAEYQDYYNMGKDERYDGKRVVNYPEFDANLAARYTFLEHWYVRPEFVGTGKVYWNRTNTKSQNRYWQVNLRAGWAKDNWEFYVFGDNLTSQYAITNAQEFYGDGYYYGSPITPLTVGLGFNWNY